MIHRMTVNLPGIDPIHVELDETIAPRTVKSLLKCLPLEISMNVWGEELYTDKTPVDVGPENSKSLVEQMDVAYWPEGGAICLFFGPTPVSGAGEIRPYSPVNVMGKIRSTGKVHLESVCDGTKAVFKIE